MPVSGSIRAFVGLGSNLADPAAQVREALEALKRLPNSRLRACSRLYRNPPLAGLDQPTYVNAVAALETHLPPLDLLHALQAIEVAQGRRRAGQRWESRTLDLDLLLYGELVTDTPELVLPHPGILERPFVVGPLYEIEPDLEIPGRGPLGLALAALDMTELRPL